MLSHLSPSILLNRCILSLPCHTARSPSHPVDWDAVVCASNCIEVHTYMTELYKSNRYISTQLTLWKDPRRPERSSDTSPLPQCTRAHTHCLRFVTHYNSLNNSTLFATSHCAHFFQKHIVCTFQLTGNNSF